MGDNAMTEYESRLECVRTFNEWTQSFVKGRAIPIICVGLEFVDDGANGSRAHLQYVDGLTEQKVCEVLRSLIAMIEANAVDRTNDGSVPPARKTTPEEIDAYRKARGQ